MAEHAVAAFEAGVSDYLLKPFTRHRVAVCRLERASSDLVLVVGEQALAVPVARDRAAEVRKALVAGTLGLLAR